MATPRFVSFGISRLPMTGGCPNTQSKGTPRERVEHFRTWGRLAWETRGALQTFGMEVGGKCIFWGRGG